MTIANWDLGLGLSVLSLFVRTDPVSPKTKDLRRNRQLAIGNEFTRIEARLTGRLSSLAEPVRNKQKGLLL